MDWIVICVFTNQFELRLGNVIEEPLQRKSGKPNFYYVKKAQKIKNLHFRF